MFRTVFEIPRNSSLKLSDTILTIGSCFADVIGNLLSKNKFQVSVNPFGNIFNPYSVHKLLRYIIRNSPVPEETFVKNGDVVLNYDFHSSCSAMTQQELESVLRDRIEVSHSFLKECKWLLITYGTSFVYERIDNGEIVANCQKMPTSNFRKHFLSQKKILEDFNEVHNQLLEFNPELQIILTLSPVRHLKDTIPLNSVSKSILRIACHTLQESFDNVHYFPAFELFMDDLRDYRFYSSDMIHPGAVGENYVWSRFMECYFDDDATKFVKAWESIASALEHRPFHPESRAHQDFLSETLRKLNTLKDMVNVEKEIKLIESQMTRE